MNDLRVNNCTAFTRFTIPHQRLHITGAKLQLFFHSHNILTQKLKFNNPNHSNYTPKVLHTNILTPKTKSSKPFDLLLFTYISLKDYCKRNDTGTVNLQETSLPRCLPGFHLGMFSIKRTASLSKDLSTPRTTTISRIEPSLHTVN